MIKTQRREVVISMRLKNIARNSFFSLISQLILILIGFFSQRTMNLIMGEELVGMNSVISNVIAILSVSELGIASAIVYHLYTALANQDKEIIISLMNLYRRAYYIFAIIITVLGFSIMPLMHLFLRENSFSLSYIRIIYSLWLIRTVLSYLLSYKRSILIADQKEYIVSIIMLLMNVFNYGSIIIILRLWQNYILALSFNIFVEVVFNSWIIYYVNKTYPFLKEFRKKTLDKNIVENIFHDIKNIFISHLSSKLLVSTDNLIMSSFINVTIVGRYSNYSLMTQSISNIMISLSNSIQPSIGNMFTEGKKEKDYQALRQITFIFFFLASFCSAGLLSLMSKFVSDFWLTKDYQLSKEIVAFLVINCYCFIISLPTAMMMTLSGMFDKERSISVLYAAVNLIISLAFVKPLGVTGVLIGTTASYLVQIIFRIRIFFKNYLHRSSIEYIIDMIQYAILSVVETILCYIVVELVYQQGKWNRLLLGILICILMPNIINFSIYIKSWRWKSIISMIRDMIKN